MNQSKEIIEANPNRKKVLISVVLIAVIFSLLTIYEYNNSLYYFERAFGEKIEYSTYNGYLPIVFHNEEYIFLYDGEDWQLFLNRTYQSSRDSQFINESMFYSFLDRNQFNSTKVYFCAFWGFKPILGYDIRIGDITLDGKSLNIYIEKSYPEGDFHPTAIDYPSHIVMIDKDDIPKDITIDVRFLNEDNLYLYPLFGLIGFLLVMIVITKKYIGGKSKEGVNN
jgi:hypothetical protein